MHMSVFVCMHVEARVIARYLPQLFSILLIFFNKIYSVFIHVYVCVYACACMFVYMHMCKCPQKPEEDVRSSSELDVVMVT